MDAFTENLIEKFIGFDNDWETESETCSNEEKSFQMYESRGAFFSVMKQIKFEKNNHGFCPLRWLRVEISLKGIICLVFQLKYMSLPISVSLTIFGACLNAKNKDVEFFGWMNLLFI